MSLEKLDERLTRLENNYRADLKDIEKQFYADIRQYRNDTNKMINDSKEYYDSLMEGYSKSMGDLFNNMNEAIGKLSNKVDDLVTATNKHATYFALGGSVIPILLGAGWAIFTFFYKP